jgi:HlyD family secretion protein
VATSAEAGVAAAEANLRQARASLEEARLEYERQRRLAESGLAAERDVIRAATARDVQAAQVQALEEEVTRARAALRGARHDLSQMRITSEISGVITKLNVEEGENAVTGTMNNPGTVLLTIADLSVLTAEVRVDETDVVNVALGQQAKVEIDAFPDTSFHGIVTEVGSSPIFRGDVFGEQAADFKVVVTLRDSIPAARPGLSATAEITTATRQNALAVPIAAVTLREWKPKEEESGAEKAGGKEGGDAGAASADTGKAPGKSPGDSAREKKGQEREGVFVVKGKKAEFRPVKTGIAGERDFEALTGLEAGDVVVTGDFRALRQLEDGDRVKIKKKKEAGREGKGRRREAEGE